MAYALDFLVVNNSSPVSTRSCKVGSHFLTGESARSLIGLVRVKLLYTTSINRGEKTPWPCLVLKYFAKSTL